MMNVLHQPSTERKEQSREGEVPLQEETAQVRSGPNDDPPGEIAVDEEEVDAHELPRDNGQVCTFKNGDLMAEEINRGWAIIPEVDLL